MKNGVIKLFKVFVNEVVRFLNEVLIILIKIFDCFFCKKKWLYEYENWKLDIIWYKKKMFLDDIF